MVAGILTKCFEILSCDGLIQSTPHIQVSSFYDSWLANFMFWCYQ